MDKPMPNLMFRGMSWMFRLRDLVSPRDQILDEAEIRPGARVLDYGCGPGAYLGGLVERVGPAGKVYALDIHPLAVQRVEEMARRRQLANVETICSNCQTGLPDDSLDAVLLYDILHGLSEPDAVLAELHRVLKPGGMLSVLDPHMGERDILSRAASGRTFELASKGEHTYRFVKRAHAAA
jgi:ubiquinone/menaquinone biosynthesis C-methylase UbiE